MKQYHAFQWNMLLLLVLLAGSLWISATRVRFEPAQGTSSPQARVVTDAAPLENRPAPDFTLTDLHGKSIHLADLRGQVVLIWLAQHRPRPGTLFAAYLGLQSLTMLLLEPLRRDSLVLPYGIRAAQALGLALVLAVLIWMRRQVRPSLTLPSVPEQTTES